MHLQPVCIDYIQIAKQKYRCTLPGPSQEVTFKKSIISLSIPKDGVTTAEGWKITPTTHPGVGKINSPMNVIGTLIKTSLQPTSSDTKKYCRLSLERCFQIRATQMQSHVFFLFLFLLLTEYFTLH